MREKVKCPECGGFGNIPMNSMTGDAECPTCHGTGFVPTPPQDEEIREQTGEILDAMLHEYDEVCERARAKGIVVGFEYMPFGDQILALTASHYEARIKELTTFGDSEMVCFVGDYFNHNGTPSDEYCDGDLVKPKWGNIVDALDVLTKCYEAKLKEAEQETARKRAVFDSALSYVKDSRIRLNLLRMWEASK